MAVHWKKHAARHIHRHGRIERGGGFGVEHFGGDAECASLSCGVGFFFECLRFFAEHEQALFHEAEVEVGQGRQFFESRPTGHADVPEQRRGLLDPCGRAGSPETPSPLEELRVEAGAYVEWGLWIPHPLEA